MHCCNQASKSGSAGPYAGVPTTSLREATLSVSRRGRDWLPWTEGRCYDHNRALAQRSRWQRDRLLEVGELGRYDRELKEAWERFFLPVGEGDDEGVDEDSVRRRARERFAELDRSNLPPIRRDVREGWVARGSLHVIADRLEIGWHPQWLAHLRDRLEEVRDDPAAGTAAAGFGRFASAAPTSSVTSNRRAGSDAEC
jgi:hypothetical protein